MNKITRYYYHSALELGLKVKPSELVPGFEFNIGKHRYFICNGFIPMNDAVSTNIAHDKYVINRILDKADFPVPESMIYSRSDYKYGQIPLNKLPYPVVVKPSIGTAFGKGVICNVKDEEALRTYLEQSFKRYPKLTIEHFEEGLKSYRVLVLDNKIIGLVERTPAFVKGNGRDTIEALIYTKNIQRESVNLPKIIVNHETAIIFNERGLTINSVPEKDEIIPLKYVCNYSQGGSFATIPVADIHPSNYKMMVDAAKTIHLKYVGFDVLCEDMTKPIEETRGYFIEANPNPGIYFHEEPFEGEPVQVSKKVILKQLAQHPVHYFLYLCKQYKNEISLSVLGLFIILHLLS